MSNKNTVVIVMTQIQNRHIHTNSWTLQEWYIHRRRYNGISLNRYANISFNRLGRECGVCQSCRLNALFGDKVVQLGFEFAAAEMAKPPS